MINLQKHPTFGRRVFLLALVAIALGSSTLVRSQPGQIVSANMDQAIALLNAALLQFQSDQDYECQLLKRERVNSTLLPESLMIMRVRNRPYSIYLRAESPEADRGMEVCYVAGWNKGMMRVHPPHMKGLLGFWSVD